MALEPEQPTLGVVANPELPDFTQRLWVSSVLAIPLLIISMGADMPGLRIMPMTLNA
jgi:Cu+-exporting ATPase